MSSPETEGLLSRLEALVEKANELRDSGEIDRAIGRLERLAGRRGRKLQIPKRHWQPGRQELDKLICEMSVGAYEELCTALDPTLENVDREDEETKVSIHVKGGYVYEVVVRLVKWPGEEFVE